MRIPLIRRAVASSSTAEGPTSRGDAISSAPSSPLPRRLPPCARPRASPLFSCVVVALCTTARLRRRYKVCQAAAPSEPRDWGGLPRRWSIPAPPDEIRRRDELQRGHPASPRPPRSSTTSLLRRRRWAAPSWGLHPISAFPAPRRRRLPTRRDRPRLRLPRRCRPQSPDPRLPGADPLAGGGGPPPRHRRAGIEKVAPAAHSLLFFSARVDHGGNR